VVHRSGPPVRPVWPLPDRLQNAPPVRPLRDTSLTGGASLIGIVPNLGANICPLFFSKACCLKNNPKVDVTPHWTFFGLRAILVHILSSILPDTWMKYLQVPPVESPWRSMSLQSFHHVRIPRTNLDDLVWTFSTWRPLAELVTSRSNR
jgi:hypothetical protein